MKLLYRLIISSILFVQVSAFATNTLTVQDPDIWGTKSAYIDKATLVIEPMGGYVQQSLYLTYSDHDQFAAGSKLEIVHRFELPAGSVINDLWLWIGDSVMQAVMMDTWTARSIYDSIVVKKHDPAFLTKSGNQYELHIYPLAPGGQRRIKINFITPTKWFGNTASAVMPLGLLNSNGATVKPLEVFFKETSNIWGTPSIIEIPQAQFQNFVDTLGFQYKYYNINDISALTSLNLTFQTYFTNGYFFDSFRKTNDNTYFQLGISPDKLFNLVHDTASHKCMVGIDLSGGHNKELSTLIPNIKGALKSALKSTDYFNVIVAGAGEIKSLSDTWIPAIQDSIDSVLNRFANSPLADSIGKSVLPTIVYCDGDAANGWQFPDIADFAKTQTYPDINTASQYFSQADIIAAYQHGYDNLMDSGTFNSILPSLNTFFTRGGRFLSYYDMNRNGVELLASHFIKGLICISVDHQLVKLYRNVNGNIGQYFPETVEHESAYYFSYDDSTVKVELMDQNGRPTVISKKIGNGLLVVSGLWELTDDGAMKTILDVPLLGLNKASQYFQLADVLNLIKTDYKSGSFDKVFLFSNSDSLFQKPNAVNWVTSYLSDLTANRPVYNTINLLGADNYTPASITDGQTNYYGSGYLTKVLSDSTYGLHFETHTNDWNYIDTTLNYNSAPLSQDFSLVPGDSANSSMVEMREINAVNNDPNKPKFFIGAATGKDSLVFNVSARFSNAPGVKTAHLKLSVNKDTTITDSIIPAMLGNEKLNDLFANSSYDTAKIVSLALKYRLLCDYTALIALEPNDTLHFMQNPNDEGGYVNTAVKDKDKNADSLSLDIFPNPFNNTTSIIVSTENPSEITLEIYNILGQRVREFNASGLVNGRKIYTWDGRNNYNRTVGSGIYFARAIIKEAQSSKITVKMKKMILLK